MEDKLISKVPEGPLAEKWTKHKAAIRVVSPANKRKLDIIVIGTGLGGASAAADFLHQRLSPPRPLYRSPGRYQRCQELSE